MKKTLVDFVVAAPGGFRETRNALCPKCDKGPLKAAPESQHVDCQACGERSSKAEVFEHAFSAEGRAS